MSTDRRMVLKGLAAAGLAMTGISSWAATAGSPALGAAAGVPAGAALNVTSLVSGAALDGAFVQGVQNAVGTQAAAQWSGQRLQGLDAATFTRLNAMLHDGTPTLLVGLVDDASATLVLDLVRSAGGRVLQAEHHRVGRGPVAQQWAQQLGQTLASGKTADLGNAADVGGTAYVSLSCVI